MTQHARPHRLRELHPPRTRNDPMTGGCVANGFANPLSGGDDCCQIKQGLCRAMQSEWEWLLIRMPF